MELNVHIILSEKKCSIQNFSLNTALYSIIIVFNFAIPGLFLSSFRLFYTVDSKPMPNINFADDWIRTVDLWSRKQLQLSISIVYNVN